MEKKTLCGVWCVVVWLCVVCCVKRSESERARERASEQASERETFLRLYSSDNQQIVKTLVVGYFSALVITSHHSLLQ